MTKRVRWTLVFLPLTALPIGLELWAGLDHSDNTIPWTDYISTYVPWPVALAAFLILAWWLPPHFVEHYQMQAREKKRQQLQQKMADTYSRRTAGRPPRPEP